MLICVIKLTELFLIYAAKNKGSTESQLLNTLNSTQQQELMKPVISFVYSYNGDDIENSYFDFCMQESYNKFDNSNQK